MTRSSECRRVDSQFSFQPARRGPRARNCSSSSPDVEARRTGRQLKIRLCNSQAPVRGLTTVWPYRTGTQSSTPRNELSLCMGPSGRQWTGSTPSARRSVATSLRASDHRSLATWKSNAESDVLQLPKTWLETRREKTCKTLHSETATQSLQSCDSVAAKPSLKEAARRISANSEVDLAVHVPVEPVQLDERHAFRKRIRLLKKAGRHRHFRRGRCSRGVPQHPEPRRAPPSTAAPRGIELRSPTCPSCRCSDRNSGRRRAKLLQTSCGRLLRHCRDGQWCDLRGKPKASLLSERLGLGGDCFLERPGASCGSVRGSGGPTDRATGEGEHRFLSSVLTIAAATTAMHSPTVSTYPPRCRGTQKTG